MAIDLTAVLRVAYQWQLGSAYLAILRDHSKPLASSDPVTQAALDQLTATLTSNDSAIAGAVVANARGREEMNRRET